MNCSKCNTVLAPGGAFCTNCGRPVTQQAVPAAPVTPTPPAAPTPPVPFVAPQPVSSVPPMAPSQSSAVIPQQAFPTVSDNPQGIVYAGFGRRLAAAIIDGLIVSVVVGMVLGFILPDSSNENLIQGIANAVFTIYSIIFLIGRQTTLGKMVLSIKVVEVDTGSKASAGKIVVRELMKYISAIILLIGYLMMLWDGKKQTLHDKVAGTIVIKGK